MEIMIQQGEDLLLEILLFEGATPLNVGPATAGLVSNVQSEVYVGGEKVAQYSLNAQQGFGTLELHNAYPNVIVLKLERAQTKTFPVGIMKVSTLATFIDPNFNDGRNVEVSNTLGRITKGDTVNLLP